MEILFFVWYLAACAVVFDQGKHRTCGAWPAFFYALLLSPVVGAWVVSSSRFKEEEPG